MQFNQTSFFGKFALGVATIGLLFSCSKEIDLDMVDDIRIKPSATVPLATARLTLDDLVRDVDSSLIIDPDDALRIYYRQDSVFTYAIDDILTIPDQDELPLIVDRLNPIFNVGVGLGTIAGAQLFSATFSSGTIDFAINSPTAVVADRRFVLSIFNASLNGQTYTDTFTLANGATTSLDSSIIDGLVFDFTDGGTQVNYLNIGLELLDTANLPNNAIFQCGLTLKDLGVEVASGYFGDRIQSAPPGDFSFDVSGLENFIGGFFLTDPSIKLFTRSTVGLPLEINTDFAGENLEATIVKLNADPFVINASPAPGVVEVSELTLDANNSNIVNFLANIPQRILYSGSVQINPNGPTATPNFIANTSDVVIDFEVDVPLEMRLVDMKLDQTIEDITIDTEQDDLLEELTMFFETDNRLPFDLDLTVSFLDKVTGDSINGFNIPLLNAAPVDANGRVSSPSISSIPVVFDADMIADFLRSDAMHFEAKVNTTNGGQTNVKLYSDYDLTIKVATQAKANIQINGL